MQKPLIKQYHLIGIGGIGMSGLARILLSKGMRVSGSDLAHNRAIDSLKKLGAIIFFDHREENVPSDATVVYSSDIDGENPERIAAEKKKCSLIHRSDMLLELTQGYKTLAVTGTHGKTTTSSLLTWLLHCGGFFPSYAVGGMIPQLNSNAEQGSGEFFILEADESDGTFLTYNTYGAIVTNIGLDHMNTFGTEQELIQSFQTFIDQVQSKKHLLWCGDDLRLQKLTKKGISYGFGSGNSLRILNYEQNAWGMKMNLYSHDRILSDVEIALTGKHNALNAAAVIGLALELGVSEAIIREALRSFRGVKRRCEVKGEPNGILFLDDYAHHPTEIRTTLEGIRKAIENRRFIAIFQPHRYTRTRDCLGSYKGIFNSVDQLIITDIFPAREIPIPGITPNRILREVNQNNSLNCRYIQRSQLSDSVAAMVEPGDVVVTLGAGDITHVSDEVMGKMDGGI